MDKNIRIVPKDEAFLFVQQLLNNEQSVAVAILLGGDRWYCVTEVLIAKTEEGELAGIATIAAEGEESSCQPTLVAIYVAKSFRHQGYGSALLMAAVDRMIETSLTPIRIDAIHSAILKWVKHLPEAKRQHIDLIDASFVGSHDTIMEA